MGSSNKIDISRFDPTNASDDQIRLWLFAIIQAELEKDDAEIDEELIDECSDCEAFLSHSNPEITQEEYAIGLAKIKERAQAMQAEGSIVTVQAKPKKRRFMRVAAYILAAALAVALLSVSVVAAFNGSAAWEFIVENIGWIWTADPGDTLDNGKVTLTKGSITAEYSSINEALQENGLNDILYPSVLPDNIIIQKINVTAMSENKYKVTFIFSQNEIRYGITNYQVNNYEKYATYEKYIIGNKTYYITPVNNGEKYQAVWIDKGFEYHLSYTEYNELINIISNLKGVE